MVSIIVANYNKGLFIRETIDSVIKQTFNEWELIIVDDSSSDNSVQIISSLLSNKRISLVINENNKGANYSRNIGLKMAKGDYIIFLDADDLLIPDCIIRRIEKAELNPEADFLVFTMGIFKQKVGDTNGLWQPISKKPLQDFLQHKLPWSILQPIWKKDFLLSLDGFDESFQRLQDVELSTRALITPNVRYMQFVGKPDCYYRIDESRLNFDVNEFLVRWTDSAIMYFDKFEKVLKPKMRYNLVGTIFQTYLQLIHYYKKNKISTDQFEFLEKKLLYNPTIISFIDVRKFLFNMARWFNLRFVKIPGINFLLKKAVVL